MPSVSAAIRTASFRCNYSVTDRELSPEHGQFRFLRDRQDVWAPFDVKSGEATVQYMLSAPKYSEAYDRGTLRGIDGDCGAGDRQHHRPAGRDRRETDRQQRLVQRLRCACTSSGSLSWDWRSTIPYYFRSYAEHARLSARSCHRARRPRQVALVLRSPATTCPAPTTRTASTNASGAGCWTRSRRFVTNVAEQFDFSGDVEWVRRHKATCERALDYMLRRDSNGNGLVEMINSNHTEKKASDWIDIVWASFENGLVNAEMYNAMVLWADVEEQLGDAGMAAKYRTAAGKLKDAFNRPIAERRAMGSASTSAMPIGATRTARSTARTSSRP